MINYEILSASCDANLNFKVDLIENGVTGKKDQYLAEQILRQLHIPQLLVNMIDVGESPVDGDADELGLVVVGEAEVVPLVGPEVDGFAVGSGHEPRTGKEIEKKCFRKC